MTKTLIIGGAGFIGAHVARALAVEGASVDILDNFSRAVRDPFLQEIKRNLQILKDLKPHLQVHR